MLDPYKARYDFGIKPGGTFCCKKFINVATRENYDKCWILEGLKNPNRAEVAIAALKNKALIDLEISTSMEAKASHYIFGPNFPNEHYFGLFTGRFIPIFQRGEPHSHAIAPSWSFFIKEKKEISKEDYDRTIQFYIDDAISLVPKNFERVIDIWYNVLMGPHPQIPKHMAGKLLWVKFEQKDTQYKFSMDPDDTSKPFTADILTNPEVYK